MFEKTQYHASATWLQLDLQALHFLSSKLEVCLPCELYYYIVGPRVFHQPCAILQPT